MSRGPGKLQDAILGMLRDPKQGKATIETTRWSLYEGMGKPCLEPGAKLPTAWNTSFQRAADTLAEHGHITITRRPLENFEECVEHYPGKTLFADKRALRCKFLPTLLEWIRDPKGIGPKYGVEENERFHFKLLPEIIRKDIEIRWFRIEERLRPIYGNLQESPDNLLRLICKGSNLFRANNVEVRIALTHLIERACQERSLPEDLVDELRHLKNLFLPSHEAGILRLKSLIHEFAEVPRHGQCSLREETLEYLHAHQTEIVENMPGFRQEASPRCISWQKTNCEYDPKLKKLFDQTVFQKFEFVSLR